MQNKKKRRDPAASQTSRASEAGQMPTIELEELFEELSVCNDRGIPYDRELYEAISKELERRQNLEKPTVPLQEEAALARVEIRSERQKKRRLSVSATAAVAFVMALTLTTGSAATIVSYGRSGPSIEQLLGMPKNVPIISGNDEWIVPETLATFTSLSRAETVYDLRLLKPEDDDSRVRLQEEKDNLSLETEFRVLGKQVRYSAYLRREKAVSLEEYASYTGAETIGEGSLRFVLLSGGAGVTAVCEYDGIFYTFYSTSEDALRAFLRELRV